MDATSTTWPTRGASGSTTWRDRRGTEPRRRATSAAVDRAIAEIGLIADPHRAIDWLSTFPQVVLLALGETP